MAWLTSLLILFLAADASYLASVEKWRRAYEASLKADGGWLTVTGLFWLKPGNNTFKADPSVGVFEFRGGKTLLRVAPGLDATVNGKRVTSAELRPDVDVVTAGRLTMYVIQRGDRYGIRVKDQDSRARREFKGLHWFPVNEAYRVTARFVPYNPPKQIPIPNVLGQVEEMPSPGYVAFKLQGKEYRLDPVAEGSKELFFIFRDLTSSKETYPSGRFLTTDMPKDGRVVLDFNKAHNPPCAFTPYATCPLPPKQNALQVSIEAGEKRYH
jgi:uncharacterized protein (DUF1684 family)